MSSALVAPAPPAVTPADSIWMSPWLLDLWWEVYGHGRCLSEGPVYVSRRHGLRRLACLGSDARCHRLPGGAAGAQNLAQALARRREWDVFDLQAAPIEQLEAVAFAFASQGIRSGRPRFHRQRYLPLHRPWAAIEGEFRAGLLGNIARRERQLRKNGALSVRRLTQPAEVAAVFEACLEIEASGWKGAGGSAIACQPLARRFYQALFVRAAVRGQFELFLLYSDSMLIAFHAYLRDGDLWAGLRTAYHEGWRRFAPSMILQRMILAAAYADGARELDFSGGDEPYKSDWTPHFRLLADVRLYRPTLPGLAALAGSRAHALVRDLCFHWRAGTIPRPMPAPDPAIAKSS